MPWMYLDSIASAGANGFLSLCSAFFLSNFELGCSEHSLWFIFLLSHFARMADLVLLVCIGTVLFCLFWFFAGLLYSVALPQHNPPCILAYFFFFFLLVCTLFSRCSCLWNLTYVFSQGTAWPTVTIHSQSIRWRSRGVVLHSNQCLALPRCPAVGGTPMSHLL